MPRRSSRQRSRRPSRSSRVLLLAVVAAASACAAPPAGDVPPRSPSVADTAPSSAGSAIPGSSPRSPVEERPAERSGPSEPEANAITIVAISVESRVADHPTSALRSRVASTLTDPRGWERAGFRFVFDRPAPPYRLVLAEGDEVDELCLPYDTEGEYSCQNGPVVALNAERWRTATPSWTGTLDGYRTMLINHEVGHLLHLHHPRPQCPGPGLPAPVMTQQSTELGACTPNPWPLQWEIDLAARNAEPLAPPADHDVEDHRPSPPAARS